jgi:hypothetical protein
MDSWGSEDVDDFSWSFLDAEPPNRSRLAIEDGQNYGKGESRGGRPAAENESVRLAKALTAAGQCWSKLFSLKAYGLSITTSELGMPLLLILLLLLLLLLLVLLLLLYYYYY